MRSFQFQKLIKLTQREPTSENKTTEIIMIIIISTPVTVGGGGGEQVTYDDVAESFGLTQVNFQARTLTSSLDIPFACVWTQRAR